MPSDLQSVAALPSFFKFIKAEGEGNPCGCCVPMGMEGIESYASSDQQEELSKYTNDIK